MRFVLDSLSLSRQIPPNRATRVNYKEYDKGAAYGTSFWLMVYWNLTWVLIDAFTPLAAGLQFSKMSNSHSENHDEATVVGFEVPKSPDSSYNNVYPGNEDEARDPPMVPSHLQHTLLNYPANRDTAGTVPLPKNVILNHLYIENRESPRSVVALGFTHRFRSKYVTVVLYKPVQRRGNTSI
ncbi:SNF1-related protein kinase regulatory subunit beta-3 [Glycine max]|nr:SNF1-related protein kinase regulatory subunit beta-3 [Glycine max]